MLKPSDVAQHGSSTKVEISCKQNGTFRMALFNCSSLTIENITLSNCITREKSDYVLHVIFCFDISLSNTAFIKNEGAVLVQNSEIEFSGRSEFSNNSAKECDSFLFINKSSKIRITGEAQLTGNTANSGGALLVYSSTVHLDNTRVFFTRNIANSGGAIALKNQSMLKGCVEKAVFRENKANEYGGAVYVNNLTFTLPEKSSFNSIRQKVVGLLH